jgi:hypothetical protein
MSTTTEGAVKAGALKEMNHKRQEFVCLCFETTDFAGPALDQPSVPCGRTLHTAAVAMEDRTFISLNQTK